MKITTVLELFGLAAGIVCYSACFLKGKFGYDDSLDVVGVHGVGGILGAILTGVFASKAINPAGNDGLLYGNPSLLVTQLTAVGITILFAVVGTAVILGVLKEVTSHSAGHGAKTATERA